MARDSASALLSKFLDEEVTLLEIHNPTEVSIVPAGMNRQVFGIRKELSVFDFNALNEVPLQNQTQIDTITKGMTDDAKGAVVAIAKAAAAFKDAIPADVLTQALGIPMVTAEAKPEPVKTAVQKAMEDPELAKVLKEAEAERVELRKALAVEQDARLAKEWVEKAGAYKSVPGFTAATLAPVLRDCAEHISKENFEQLTKHFAGCEAISAELCKMTGRPQNEPDDGDPDAKINSIAKELQAKNPGMTDAQARTEARKANPGLYE